MSDPYANADGRDGRSLLELLIDTVPDHAVVILDAHGTVTSWNAGAQRVFGQPASDVVGHGLETLFDPEDGAGGSVEQQLAITAADGWYHEELWRTRRDGERLWVSTTLVALRGSDLRLVGFGMLSRDLTEHRRGEELLRDSEERFRLLVNNVADYAIFLVDPDGRVASWNLGAERLKGYRADEILGRPLATFYTQHDARNGVPGALLRRALDEGHVEAEGWRVRKDGTEFWASVVITALRGADGSHRGFAKVTKDLTERKRNEDALRGVLERERDAAAQLRELDEMRADVVAIIAHDLRTPLNVAHNLVHLARLEWPTLTDAAKLEHLHRIGARLDGMATLVDDLFDLVRIDARQLVTARQPFDMTETVQRAIADGVPPADVARIVADLEPGVIAIGDSHRSWEVIINLLSNALKFATPATPIRVTVKRTSGAAEVSISDEGPGIGHDRQHLLFQRFSRLDPAGNNRGAGLGLYIARSMVEAQAGTIGVRSAAGEGSTFWFRLPTTS